VAVSAKAWRNGVAAHRCSYSLLCAETPTPHLWGFIGPSRLKRDIPPKIREGDDR
jgi:hypothetical protein